jgi:hypothetical protein
MEKPIQAVVQLMVVRWWGKRMTAPVHHYHRNTEFSAWEMLLVTIMHHSFFSL